MFHKLISEIDGDFIKIEGAKINSFNYKRIKDANIDTLKSYVYNDKHSMGFTTDGMINFFIDYDKIVEEKGITLYIHKERFENIEKKEEKDNETIPKNIHFIWFFGGRPFNLVNYIAIKSSLFHNPEYKVYLHCTQEPKNNIYFEDLRNHIIVNIIKEPYYINNYPVKFYQHKADYVRLNILKSMGGIYFDTDYILLKNLDSFLNNNFVMGKERPNSDEFYCNCVIMSTPNNKIIDEWLHIYENSWGENFIASWMGHSVMIPPQLAKKYDMTVCENYIFYPFLWNDLSILHEKDNLKNYEDSLGVHLWDTEASKTDLLPINLDYFKTKNNAFVRLFKKHVDELIIKRGEEKEECEIVYINDRKYKFYRGYDSKDNDVTFYRENLENLEKLAYKGNYPVFNSLGFIKYRSDELIKSKWIDENNGVYIKYEEDIENIFLITSVINVSKAPLNYHKVRSIFNSEERFNQTLNTIMSIKSRLPKSKIYIIECSKITEEQSNILKLFVNGLFNISSEISEIVNGPNKSLAESIILQTGIEKIKKEISENSRIFKISGRYYLNDNFLIENFSTNLYTFHNKGKSLVTSFFSFPGKKTQDFLEILKKAENFMREKNTYVDIESTLSIFVPKEETSFISNLGISGREAPTGKLIIN